MTDKEALHAAAALLSVGHEGGQEKTASANAEINTSDVFEELGRESFREIIKEAQDEAAMEQVDEGFEKVASLLILDAAERGVLEDLVKTASEGNADLAQAMWTLLTEED